MKYTLHIITNHGRKFYFRIAGFTLFEEKRSDIYQPRYFDTIEAARSVAMNTVEKGTYDFVYLCDTNGAQIERIERK